MAGMCKNQFKSQYFSLHIKMGSECTTQGGWGVGWPLNSNRGTNNNNKLIKSKTCCSFFSMPKSLIGSQSANPALCVAQVTNTLALLKRSLCLLMDSPDMPVKDMQLHMSTRPDKNTQHDCNDP